MFVGFIAFQVLRLAFAVLIRLVNETRTNESGSRQSCDHPNIPVTFLSPVTFEPSICNLPGMNFVEVHWKCRTQDSLIILVV